MGNVGFRRSNAGLILLAITIVGALLRLVTLDAHGFWGDEVNSLDGASLGFPGFITDRFGYLANQTPLHYLIVWLTSSIADPATTSIWVRLPSALAGILTIPLIYGLGKELFGPAQGLIAAILLMLSPTHLNYSQDLRLYSLMLFLNTLVVYCLLRAVRASSEETNSAWGWWLAFAIAEIANVSNAYIALTLSTLPLLLILAWVILKLGRARHTAPRAFLSCCLATGIVLLGLLANALDLLGTHRVAPSASKVELASIPSAVIELLTWFTDFGASAGVERLQDLLFFLIALLGVFLALANPIRAERRLQGAVICLVYTVIPAAMLAVFATTSVVFQRYALFGLPFYLLLAAQGVVSLYRLASVGQSVTRPRLRRVMQGGAVVLGGLMVTAFAIGTVLYENPQTHIRLAYRPDFRGAAQYLDGTVNKMDMVVFLDDPGLGYTITNFYWHRKPPTRAYDARDPRLFAQELHGNIYWVVSMEQVGLLDDLSGADMGWADVHRFERVVVLRETGPTGIKESFGHILSKLESVWPDGQPVLTLRGSLEQANGKLAEAVATYRQAGTYFPVGDDYLRAGIGYEAMGWNDLAWREADISKFWQPFRPQVHEWYARKLAEEGFDKESHAEQGIAERLTRK